MGPALAQRRLFRHRTFTLADDGIRVRDRTPISGRVYMVPLEVLFGERVELRTSALEGFVLWIGAGCLAILFTLGPRSDVLTYVPLFGGLSLIGAVYWWRSRRELICFTTERTAMYVLRHRPSPEAVDHFLDEARRFARDRIRTRVLPLERTDDEVKDRTHAMWLRDKGILTAEECAEFLQRRFSPYRDRDPN